MLAWLWTRLSDGGPQVSISGRALRQFPEREVERLLRSRLLIEHPKADSWSVCAHCDCSLDVRPVRQIGDELRACCPHDAAEDVVLEDDDLTRFGIDANRLAGQIGAGGGSRRPGLGCRGWGLDDRLRACRSCADAVRHRGPVGGAGRDPRAEIRGGAATSDGHRQGAGACAGATATRGRDRGPCAGRRGQGRSGGCRPPDP